MKNIIVKGIDCLQAAFIDYCEDLGCKIDSSIKEDFKNLEPVPYLQIRFEKSGVVIVEKVNTVNYNTFKLPEDWKKVTETIKKVLKAPKFKIGDWVVVDNIEDIVVGKIGAIGKIVRHSNIMPEMLVVDPKCGGVSFLPQNLRHATSEEIKEFLIEEAKKRGFVEGLDLSRIKGAHYAGNIKPYAWYYSIEADYLGNLGAKIYQNGVWAEINPENIRLPFGTETVEVLQDGRLSTSIGTISTESIEDIHDIIIEDLNSQNELSYDPAGVYKTMHFKIEKIRIGHVTGTIDELRKIVETSYKMRGL